MAIKKGARTQTQALWHQQPAPHCRTVAADYTRPHTSVQAPCPSEENTGLVKTVAKVTQLNEGVWTETWFFCLCAFSLSHVALRDAFRTPQPTRLPASLPPPNTLSFWSAASQPNLWLAFGLCF